MPACRLFRRRGRQIECISDSVGRTEAPHHVGHLRHETHAVGAVVLGQYHRSVQRLALRGVARGSDSGILQDALGDRLQRKHALRRYISGSWRACGQARRASRLVLQGGGRRDSRHAGVPEAIPHLRRLSGALAHVLTKLLSQRAVVRSKSVGRQVAGARGKDRFVPMIIEYFLSATAGLAGVCGRLLRLLTSFEVGTRAHDCDLAP
mmetsp:Transcript_91315/g.263542  ORF Transcript_91315/g.263542 Transcript_91315/m.263542 type:complete len:207 (-) Transcript_91315:88-708(-)